MPPLKNLKHEQFARKYAKALANPTKPIHAKEVYKEVFPDCKDNTAEVQSSEIMAIPDTKPRIIELLEQYDLSLAKCTKKLGEQTVSTKGIYYEGRKISDDPDNSARNQALQIAFKLHGHLSGESTSIFNDNRSIVFTANSPQIERLQKVTMQLRSLREKSRQEAPNGK